MKYKTIYLVVDNGKILAAFEDSNSAFDFAKDYYDYRGYHPDIIDTFLHQ